VLTTVAGHEVIATEGKAVYIPGVENCSRILRWQQQQDMLKLAWTVAAVYEVAATARVA